MYGVTLVSIRLKKVEAGRGAKASSVPLCQMKKTICERVYHEVR